MQVTKFLFAVTLTSATVYKISIDEKGKLAEVLPEIAKHASSVDVHQRNYLTHIEKATHDISAKTNALITAILDNTKLDANEDLIKEASLKTAARIYNNLENLELLKNSLLSWYIHFLNSSHKPLKYFDTEKKFVTIHDKYGKAAPITENPSMIAQENDTVRSAMVNDPMSPLPINTHVGASIPITAQEPTNHELKDVGVRGTPVLDNKMYEAFLREQIKEAMNRSTNNITQRNDENSRHDLREQLRVIIDDLSKTSMNENLEKNNILQSDGEFMHNGKNNFGVKNFGNSLVKEMKEFKDEIINGYNASKNSVNLPGYTYTFTDIIKNGRPVYGENKRSNLLIEENFIVPVEKVNYIINKHKSGDVYQKQYDILPGALAHGYPEAVQISETPIVNKVYYPEIENVSDVIRNNLEFGVVRKLEEVSTSTAPAHITGPATEMPEECNVSNEEMDKDEKLQALCLFDFIFNKFRGSSTATTAPVSTQITTRIKTAETSTSPYNLRTKNNN